MDGWAINKLKVRRWIFQTWKNAEREKKMASNKKTNLSWRRFLAIPGVFPYPVLVFHNAVSTLFLLLWWKSHNGRYWLLYFLSVYPPLAFVIAEQEDMPDRRAMLSLQNQNIFFLIIWNPVGSRGGIQEGRCRGSECLSVGLVGGRGRGGGRDAKCQITRSAQGMWKVSTASEAIWAKGSSMQSGLHVPSSCGWGSDWHVHPNTAASTTQNSKVIPLWLHPPLSMWSHTHRGYMQRNYCFSGLIWRPPTHWPRGMFYQYCMWGVPPMALTHIPLMPAGDVASGVETSRGLGTVNTEETLPGAAYFSLWWKSRRASYL